MSSSQFRRELKELQLIMICRSCQRQPACLPARLAVNDATLSRLLERLDTCDNKLEVSIFRGWCDRITAGIKQISPRRSALWTDAEGQDQELSP